MTVTLSTTACHSFSSNSMGDILVDKIGVRHRFLHVAAGNEKSLLCNKTRINKDLLRVYGLLRLVEDFVIIDL